MPTETSSNLAYISNENHATGSISERGFLAKNDGTTFAPQIDAADVKIAEGKYLAAALENLVLAYAQDLSEGQRKAVRENIKAVSYEDASLEASDAAIARKNIGAVSNAGDTIKGKLLIEGALILPPIGSDDTEEDRQAVTRKYVNRLSSATGMSTAAYDANDKWAPFDETIPTAIEGKIAAAKIEWEKYTDDEITKLSGEGGTIPGLVERIAALEDKVSTLETLISNFETPVKGSVCYKINEVASDLSIHAARGDNPHSVTKTQVKLGYVENKKLTMKVSADGKTLSTSYKVPEE